MLHTCPKADTQVLGFIETFTNTSNDLVDVFTKGYCYHFASMLRATFNRGESCLAYPDYHIVWYDSGLAYDIQGVYTKHTKLIPIQYLDKYIDDFKHIPNVYADESVCAMDAHVEKLIEDGYFIE